ncbi:hypothetical protein AB1Y20_016818 [Prymnesium parvum]|uniref:isoleucine--tRNA ligase n=1 Tax=Prymnesium parvum TaxID=97485 RepID=A0AB34IB65_PRYPA
MLRGRVRWRCDASFKASLKASLNLPKTSFPLNPKPAAVEPCFAPRLSSGHYKAQVASRAGAEAFVLHDGPPYANGELHMGHFLNKVLKDVINRWKLLQGYRVHYVPGWDCHGLPIELKALEALGADAAADLAPLELRKAAAECARHAIRAQREAFLRWGVMADWDHAYTTMQPAYEAAQLGVLRGMLQRGLIHRGERPVHWSPVMRTALAEAELEYERGHVSTAAYIRFGAAPASPLAAALQLEEGVGALIWTTMPWTIAANQALCVNPTFVYAPMQWLLVAESRVEAVAAALGAEVVQRGAGLAGRDLAGMEWEHPLSRRRVPMLCGAHVTDDSGTGLVHTAPGHGDVDFAVGKAHGLHIASPVDERGCFTTGTAEAAPFAGLPVLGEGNVAVLEALRGRGALLASAPYTHSYPYDWRSKTPIIFRTTAQWFVDLEKVRQPALRALEDVNMVPPNDRLGAFVRGRNEWCLSRQRVWGVPLPAFYHVETGEALLTDEVVAHVQELVRERGANCWWELDAAELLPPSLQSQASLYRKGTDTLDVWFDSGCSWSAVLPSVSSASGTAATETEPRVLADVYLEGSDQHRGWFQSSLLTHVGVHGGGAPYRNILTHGFVVDEKGNKMSKSRGNVLNPTDLIGDSRSFAPKPDAILPKAERKKLHAAMPVYGVDVLRLWVAMVDWKSNNVAVGHTVLQKTRDVYHRLRNSCRFMLGNLNDFDPDKHSLPLEKMRLLDRYMLHQLGEYLGEVEAGYNTFNPSRVIASVVNFAAYEMSSEYFDRVKDRLYCGAADGESRRAVQTVLHETRRHFLMSIAPVLPFLVEELQHHRHSTVAPTDAGELPYSPSVFEDQWSGARREWMLPQLAESMRLILSAKREVTKALHQAQLAKRLKSTAEALVLLQVDGGSELHKALELVGSEINDLFLVCGCRVESSASLDAHDSIAPEKEGAQQVFHGETVVIGEQRDRPSKLRVTIYAGNAPKCGRCWRHVPEFLEAGDGGSHGGWTYRGCACHR